MYTFDQYFWIEIANTTTKQSHTNHHLV